MGKLSTAGHHAAAGAMHYSAARELSVKRVHVLPAALSGLTVDAACQTSLLHVLSIAEAMTGDRDRAVELMLCEPLHIFDGQTAVELVVGGRARDVAAYLESLSAGSAG